MRKLYRFLIGIYSFSTALFALLFLALLLNGDWALGLPIFFAQLVYHRIAFVSALVVALAIFALSILVLVYALTTGRLRKTRVRSTEIGLVEIGVDALESIALNAAKTAQAGVKTAKARVFAAQGSKVNVELRVELFSDVEIPAQMNKIQERVKKDIERYTGIQVAAVTVRVTGVESVGAKVER